MKQDYKIWAGYAFEALCMKHLKQITQALNIKTSGIYGSWQYAPKSSTEDGVQIDLLIDRLDKAITLCEIKFHDAPFKIDKHYAKVLLQKIETFKKQSKTAKQLFLAIITANGLIESVYKDDVVDGMVILDDLFLE